MDHSTLVDTLVERDVLDVDGGDVVLTAAFERAYEQHLAELTRTTPDEFLDSVGGDEELTAVLTSVGADDPHFVAGYRALRERTGLSDSETVRLVPVIDQFRRPANRTDGVPNGFLPVPGQRVVTLVTLYRRTIVYAWREDCPPCDEMKAVLERLDVPGAIARLAVYGPDCPTVLRDEFDAAVAPTTLFTLDGRVESRSVGVRGVETLERELEEFLKTPV